MDPLIITVAREKKRRTHRLLIQGWVYTDSGDEIVRMRSGVLRWMQRIKIGRQEVQCTEHVNEREGRVYFVLQIEGMKIQGNTEIRGILCSWVPFGI